MSSPRLLQNAIYIPEDDVFIKSCHTHDYSGHTFKDNKMIAVDGGTSYARRVGDLYELSEANRYEEYTLTDDDKFEGWITDRLLWGEQSPNGSGVFIYRTIKELAHRPDGVNHLRTILNGTLKPSPLHTKVMEYWVDKLSSFGK